MSWKTECGNCGAKVEVIERPMGVPGGKCREEANCPKCGHKVASMMTDGFLDARLVEDDFDCK